ncbi:DUF4062 domain-containing protein [Limnoglobus roseus]|uniref:DUF4062 domain-containing protein n=1 Tax=Limnoglobus roseus TaxID=2598579 RepID=A0A5C1AHW1_9BACT|nr:DUF4062 domain-containing protein [Limnoglobus roseus]QEL17242.1 hypothetical protein PX52LOC_04225 [Limnoglobus roseus]
MKPPTFFLSSTIYDFKDLRSAIKYFLERQGCRVLASDFNDFPKPLENHSYEGCLKSIAEAHFFILLIGARVGGWYNEPNQISITQQEYREAYRLHEQGKLKILAFVRANVWQMKDDRKLLAKHIQEMDLDPGAKAQVMLAPTKAATNAEFISRFIEEVGKSKETASATKGQGTYPTGNWLHIFEQFGEIIEQLQVQAFTKRPVEEVALRRLLRDELHEFVRISLVRGQKSVFSSRRTIEHFYARMPEKLMLDKQKTTVNTEEFDQLCSHWIGSCLNTKFYPVVLPRSLASPLFMEYCSQTGTMAPLPVHTALVRLTIELESYEIARQKADCLGLIGESGPRQRGGVGETIQVSTIKLLGILIMMDRVCNIIELSKAIIQHLDGQLFLMPSLRPRSPLYAHGELEREDVTAAETEAFLLM